MLKENKLVGNLIPTFFYSYFVKKSIMKKQKVSFEEIEEFLEGRDPQKYIVSIEASYHENFVSLIINDPDTGKRIEQHSFQPFVWLPGLYR